MINNNSLSDRLNAVKQGVEVPKIIKQNENPINQQINNQSQNEFKNESLRFVFLSRIMSYVDSFLASFLYGFAVKTIFGLSWSLFGVFAVGFLINHSISVFPKIIFPNYYDKSKIS